MGKSIDDRPKETLYRPEATLFYSERCDIPAADVGDQKVHRDEDKPFQPCLTLSETVSARALRLPQTARPQVQAAIHALVANLIELIRSGQGQWLFYSRDNNHYVGLSRYVPKFYRRNAVVEAVDRLSEAELVIDDRTKPSPLASHRSRIRPGPVLLDAIDKLEGRATEFHPREVIVLRDEHGRPIPYTDTGLTRAWRTDVQQQNDFLSRFVITLQHPKVHIDRTLTLIVAGRRLNPDRTCYYRVSNKRFGLGGRWYACLSP